ncbi:hypothetical protein CEW92_05230 [Bacillaceae bacterium SAS-127]|nr:hypothetical protein CEW92_05230 [Bacillaceae bacterium SAS-127]
MTQLITKRDRQNLTIDWHIRASAQAGMKRLVKRLLKEYDYPSKASETCIRRCPKTSRVNV